ncbi:MAG: NADH:ubiquinone reductase (Na(+)-transporting) subunit D [Deferribacterota bacterium]|nr:NADH:ubiquinone reductase (Na(+)-transporting) subunit D [Deferribacterota bacterium]
MKKYIDYIRKPLFKENPITVQVLGICSALAVTTTLENSIVMSLAVIFVVAFSNLIISLIRSFLPFSIRIIIEMAVIASLVIIVDQFIKAYFYDISRQLSVFVGLIITNCIVLGRVEAFAKSNPPIDSFFDGIGNALGYTLILIVVGAIREFFGSGSLLGYEILKLADNGGWYEPNGMFLLSPSAFFIIGVIIWYVRFRNPSIQES